MADTVRPSDMIAFWIGTQEYCVPVTSIREIRSWTPTTQIPYAPSYILGVVNLRGTVVPILDLAARFGYAPATPTPRHAIMIAEVDGQVVGLLVDGVSGILTIAENQFQPTPDVAMSGDDGFIDGVLSLDNRLVSLVSLRATLPKSSKVAA